MSESNEKLSLYPDYDENLVDSLLFKHSNDALFFIHWNYIGEKIIHSCNSKTIRLLGYSSEEIQGLDFGKLFPDPEFCENISQFLKITSKTLFLRSSIRNKAGLHLPIEIAFEKRGSFVIALMRENVKNLHISQTHSNKGLLLDTIIQPLLLIDYSGTILECNPTAANRLENTNRETLIGKNLFELLPQEVSRSRKKRVLEAINLRKSINFIDERNGFTYNNHYYPIVNEKGIIDKIAIWADDITDINNLQKRLSLTQFSVDKSGVSIIWLDQIGKLTYANELAYQKLGYRMPELLELHVWDIFPEQKKEIFSSISLCIKETGTYSNELKTKRKDQNTFPAFVSVNYIEIEDKTQYFVFFFDISEKQDFQWELNKLYNAIEQSPISISITDPDAIIEYVNPRYCEVSGYTFEECIGAKEGFLKSGERSKHEYDQIWETLKSRKTWKGIFHNKNKQGQSFWENVTISSIIDKSGNIKNFLALKEDITENKILQQKLYQSQKMEALGRLAGGIAHDFNNLLTIILGYSQVLEDERDNPYLNEISEIIKTTEKAASLTAQLLAFSKRQVLQPKLLNLNSILKQMYSMLRRTFPSYISLHFDLSEQDLPVIIDKVQFEQVILNLAFNAKEAILPKGRGNIRISSKLVKSQEIEDSGKFFALISIEDDGIGMNETTKNSAFEPFFTTKLKGTGLGLSTVYGIVSQSDGYIEIDSEIGKGTCFKSYFPIKFEKVNTSILQTNELSSLSGEETILLIEDDKDVRKILSLLLRKSGYIVIEARNGVDGLEQYSLKRESIDLVISDLVMPEMGGLEVIQKIRAKNPLVKSMFISGYTGDQQGILGKDETIITKPIDRVKLLETIKSILCCIPEREANA